MMRRIATAAILGTLCLTASASAETYEPTRLDDPVPNKCKPSDCSLREAVRAANKDTERDKILLKKGIYKLELEFGDGTVFETDGLDVFTSTVIRGRGPGASIIAGNGIDLVI